MKSATGKESDHGLSSMSSLVAKAVIGEKSDSGLLLASSSGMNEKSDSGLLLVSSSGMKAVIGEGDSDSVLLLMYPFRREASIGEEYLFRIIVGCGLILIVGKCRIILYVVTEYYQGSRSMHLGGMNYSSTHFFNSSDQYPMITFIHDI